MTKKRRRKHHKRHPVLLFFCVFTAVVASGTLLMAGLNLLLGEGGGEWAGQRNTVRARSGGEDAGHPDMVKEKFFEIEAAEHQTEEEKPQEMQAGPEELAFAFAGDILFDDNYAPMASLKQRGGQIASCFSEELWETMHAADVFVVNNEFTYTDRGAPTENKMFTFRARPESVSYLADMGADLVTLANNHSYDYGEVSLTDTLDILTEAGIPYIGAGRNIQEAAGAAVYRVGDKSIAVIAATQIERQDVPDTKGATDVSPGVFRCFNPDKLYQTVEQAGENCDYVIVFIHWGTENSVELDWAQRDQAKGIVEAGADLIIGSHPHCLQEVGYIEGVPVIYSLGNFWFNSKALDTCLLEVRFTEDGIKEIRFLPARQEDCRTSLLAGSEKDRVIAYMNSISGSAVLDGDGVMRPR